MQHGDSDARWELQAFVGQIVADEQHDIEAALEGWSVGDARCDIVISSGGTGFAPRDVTPEATRAVCDRLASGLMQLLALNLKPEFAALSRGVIGICARTLVVNLPGQPKAIDDHLRILMPAFADIVEQLN